MCWSCICIITLCLMAAVLPPASQAQPKPTIAVLPFEMMGEYALSPMAIRGSMGRLLDKTGIYQVISDRDVLLAAEDMSLVPGIADEQQYAALGKTLGADMVIFGGMSHADPMFVTMISIMDVAAGSIINSVTQPYEGLEADWLRLNIPEVLSQLTGQTLERLTRIGDGSIALLRSRVHESMDKLNIKVDNMKLRHLPDQTDCLVITDVPVGMHTLDIEYFSFGHQSQVNSYGLTVRENEVHSLKIDILRDTEEMRLRTLYPGLILDEWKSQMGTDYREYNIFTMTLEELLQ
jgi:hypothetical protein